MKPVELGAGGELRDDVPLEGVHVLDGEEFSSLFRHEDISIG